MANFIFDRAKYNLAQGKINLLTDDIRVILMSSAYVPNASTQHVYTDITATEITGVGYITAGQRLLNPQLVEDDVNNWTKFTGTDMTWTTATLTARYAVLYDNTEVSKSLIALYDFNQEMSSYGGDYIIAWDSLYGIFRIS
jgi:hypothetical protein